MKAQYKTYEETYYKREHADSRAIVLLKYGWAKADIWIGHDDNDETVYHLKVTRRIKTQKEV